MLANLRKATCRLFLIFQRSTDLTCFDVKKVGVLTCGNVLSKHRPSDKESDNESHDSSNCARSELEQQNTWLRSTEFQ